MREIFKLILLLSLLISVDARKKEKRDLSDLKEDPVLSSIFSSDVLEDRKDRSISPLDEPFGKSKEENKSVLLRKKPTKKRDAELTPDFMNLNKNTPTVSTSESASNELSIDNIATNPLTNYASPNLPQSLPSNTFLFNRQTMDNYASSIPSIEAAANLNQNIPFYQNGDANPQPMAANYLPLYQNNGFEQQFKYPARRSIFPFYPKYNQMYLWQQNNETENKRHIFSPFDIKLKDFIKKQRMNETKKSLIPETSTANENEKPALSKNSFPLHLRVHSPNMQLKSVVPHVTEYGETAESVIKYQKEFKKSFFPQQPFSFNRQFVAKPSANMYSNEIFKKSSIPEPPHLVNKHFTKRSNLAKPTQKSNSKKSNKKKDRKKSSKKNSSKSSSKSNVSKKQNVPSNYLYQPYYPVAANYQQNQFSVQQSMYPAMPVYPQQQQQQHQQQTSTQVKNMDGLLSRPLISDEPCSDQFITCVDFAKNNYCTDYPEQMKVQCRKSCKYCTVPEEEVKPVIQPVIIAPVSVKSNLHPKVKNATTSLNTSTVSADLDHIGSGSGYTDNESGLGSGSGSNEVSTGKSSVAGKSPPADIKPSKIKNHSTNADKSTKPNVTLKPAKLKKRKSSKHASKRLSKHSRAKNATLTHKKRNFADKKTVISNPNKSNQTVKSDTGSGSGISAESGDSQDSSGSGAYQSVSVNSAPVKSERNRIWSPTISVKHNLGEFSLPFKKDVIPMPSLNVLNMNVEQSSDSTSGSGSGSGNESGDESGDSSGESEDGNNNILSTVLADVKPVFKQPKAKRNVTSTFVLPQKGKSNKMKNEKSAKKSKFHVPAAKANADKSSKKITKKSHVKLSKAEEKVTSSSKPSKVKPTKSKANKAKSSNSKHKNQSAKSTKDKNTKKTKVPTKPNLLTGAYPRIDLKSIASALAHYEEAALELAGEYPKPNNNIDITEYQRSRIPRPNIRAVDTMERYKQNIQIAKILQNERLKKENIPRSLNIPIDAKIKAKSESVDADNLDLVRQRFLVPGVEPTLNDYYAETGKLNPFESKQTKSYKKSRIEIEKRKKKGKYDEDPYQYLRNMHPGASMEPIEYPKGRSSIPSDHSFPVVLMKVSPADSKYLPEEASKRGQIRKLNAEGLPIDDKPKKSPSIKQVEAAIRKAKIAPVVRHPFAEVPAPAQPVPYNPPAYQSPFEPPPMNFQQTPLYQNPMTNYVEQSTIPQQMNQAFTQQRPVSVETPPIKQLRSKMLSAFFSVKNSIPTSEEGSGGGIGGSGGGAINRDFVDKHTGSKKTISLQSLLFDDDFNKQTDSAIKHNWSAAPAAQSGNLKKLQDASSAKSFAVQDVGANYLQSNLDALTPENGKPSLESLTAPNIGAEFTTKMSKTQETNWVRPNAESELASAMPESTGVESNQKKEVTNMVSAFENTRSKASLKSRNRGMDTRLFEDMHPVRVIPSEMNYLQQITKTKVIQNKHSLLSKGMGTSFQGGNKFSYKQTVPYAANKKSKQVSVAPYYYSNEQPTTNLESLSAVANTKYLSEPKHAFVNLKKQSRVHFSNAGKKYSNAHKIISKPVSNRKSGMVNHQFQPNGFRKTVMLNSLQHQLPPTKTISSKFKAHAYHVDINRNPSLHENDPTIQPDDLPPATDYIKDMQENVIMAGAAHLFPASDILSLKDKTRSRLPKPSVKRKIFSQESMNPLYKKSKNPFSANPIYGFKNQHSSKTPVKSLKDETFRPFLNRQQLQNNIINKIAFANNKIIPKHQLLTKSRSAKYSVAQQPHYKQHKENGRLLNPSPQIMMFAAPEKTSYQSYAFHQAEPETTMNEGIVNTKTFLPTDLSVKHPLNKFRHHFVLPPVKFTNHSSTPLRSSMDNTDQQMIYNSFLQSDDESESDGIADALYDTPTYSPSNTMSVPSIEMSSLQHQPFQQTLLNMEGNQHTASVRDQVPKLPVTRAKLLSKSIIPADMFSGQTGVNNPPQSLRRKLINKNIFDVDVPKKALQVPNIAVTSLKDTADKSLLMEFPKSPYTLKSNIQQDGGQINWQQPPTQLFPDVNFNSPYTNPNSEQTNNNNPPYAWRQYVPFPQANVINTPASQGQPQYQASNANHQIIHNEQSSSLSAKIGAARYAIADQDKKGHDKVAHQQNDQYAGWDYLVQKPDSIKPLAMTTKDETPNVKKPEKNKTLVAKLPSTPILKNLIKQQPDLDCGSNWEGAEGDFGTFCYKEMKIQATFDDALAECRRLKSDMFSILNAYENRYLQDNLHGKFWIGYRDKGMNGNWNWTDNSRSIYTNWGSSGMASTNTSHDCVYIDGEEGEWKDEACLKKKPFLCKAKTDSCSKQWKTLKLNSATGCYKLYTEAKTWEEAEITCQKQKAHLASVTSEDEQTMVFQVHSSKSFWIGFNDRESEGDWQWTDRSTSSFTNWADKSPNNGGISCATIVDGGKWKDESCNGKNMFVCKRKGPKPEKNNGLDNDGILLPVSRLLNNADTAPSHVYDELSKNGPRPVVPIYFWPLLKTSKSGMAGNRPMAAHGDIRSVPGGVALDGVHSFLDGGDFHGKCLTEPDKCAKGFAIAVQVYFANNVRDYKKPHCVVDTSGGGKGFTIFIADNKLNYRVIEKDQTWELKTDLTVERWQELVMTWHKNKGITVYVNGAFKDAEAVGIQTKHLGGGTARLMVGRESKDKGPYTCTKMVVASVAVFTKMLSVEDVPYAFTYGDTVVASYRWLMSGLHDSIIQGAPEMDVKNSLIDVDGGIYIDGESGWLDITDFDPIFNDPSKSKHGLALSFKIKFDQRVRDYKEPKYILDTGGHNGGIRGISIYLLNDNLYFQVVTTPDEDTMIWKVRTPIYTVRWQQVVISWRLDKGLWVYLDGSFRGFTKFPETLPGQTKENPKRFYIGKKIVGNPTAGAQFAFGCLAAYTRFLSKDDTDNVFGGVDNPFPGIIREVWKNTPGENLTALTTNPDFPNNPTTIEIIENFDAPFNVENDYGSKLKGYFIAPETGNNTFYLSCSRSCGLYFSSDEETKNKTQIISLNKPTWHNQWNKYANQSSVDIFLVAGKYYYLEAIHKGVDASDSLSVGVKMPTGRYQRPISKENLQWRLPGNQHAGLIREVWYDIPGYTIADLTSNSNFPSRASTTEILDKFDAPFNVDDNYGSRISGYFHAPETGDYRFYLSSDSSGELWISSDDSESNLVKIVTLNGWTDHNQWLKYPEQKSDKIFLAVNRYYYIRVYMKADKLGDCASVAVELPSGHFEGPIKKKHLSWKLINSKGGPGPDEIIETIPKAIGLFPLNDASIKNELGDSKKALIISDADLTSGPGGIKDNALLFKGNSSSFVEIPNDGSLDAKNSITLLANIYPTGEDGPIINYRRDGWGVHLWQFSGTQLFVRFVTREGHMSTQPLGTRVLELNKWNQVGASYDKSSGVAQLWHDGKMVKSRNIGQVNLLTNASIRLGAREGDDRCYKGKISCVQIYDKALREKQIGELRKCPKQIKGPQIATDYDDLTVFTEGSGIQPAFEDIEALENRLGDDTEEELIATRCEPNPCSNNGVCLDDDKKIDGYICSCSSDFTGKRCQVSRPAAENPIVKKTEIPAAYEKKVGMEAYAINESTSTPNTKNYANKSLLYQKLGCYNDDVNSRDLKEKMQLQEVTQEHCAKSCETDQKGFSYFGLQNGTSCFCGKSYGRYGKVSDDECNKKCNGNHEENCGGDHANIVYFFGIGKNYTVETFTGRKLGAGTDAKIYLEFIGERGSSDFRRLDDSLDKYEPGSVDKQSFILPDLGKIKRMKILHDNTGTAPSWYLEKIQVSNEANESFEFDCKDWLSDTQSGGKLERELQARSTIPNDNT